MAWEEAVIRLREPTCPVASRLRRGQRLQCTRPGDGIGVAKVEGDVAGWEPIDEDGTCRPSQACAGCPAQGLGQDVVVRTACVEPGQVTLYARARGRSAVLGMYQRLRSQQAEVQRIGRPAAGHAARWVDLGDLTPRQWDALRAAGRSGYFADGQGRRQNVEALASEMGCGRSAAHEHLRRALARVVEDIAAPENQ